MVVIVSYFKIVGMNKVLFFDKLFCVSSNYEYYSEVYELNTKSDKPRT